MSFHCEKCNRIVSPKGLYQDAKSLKCFCEKCYVEAMFSDDKSVVTLKEKKSRRKV